MLEQIREIIAENLAIDVEKVDRECRFQRGFRRRFLRPLRDGNSIRR